MIHRTQFLSNQIKENTICNSTNNKIIIENNGLVHKFLHETEMNHTRVVAIIFLHDTEFVN